MTERLTQFQEDVLVERQMARQSQVYPNWPLITHAQLKGWYDSHRALRAERDALRVEVADLKKRLGYPRFAR